MKRLVQVSMLATALACGIVSLSSCSAERRDGISRGDELPGVERRRPVGEELSWSDKAGEIAVVVLAVGVVIGGILLPILIL